VELPELTVLPIGEIKPYPNNPRRIPKRAVDAVAESIDRYGYQQPIVVDSEYVVIVGHTRLQALQKLGWTEVPVYVADLTEDQAKEYRLIDNRTGEMTAWDHAALVQELREFEQGLLDSYFPDIDLEIGAITEAINASDVAAATSRVTSVTEANPVNTHTTQVVCPSCFHSFEVKTKSLPGLTFEDMNDLAYATDTESGSQVAAG
jgi:hypothetical protein